MSPGQVSGGQESGEKPRGSGAPGGSGGSSGRPPGQTPRRPPAKTAQGGRPASNGSAGSSQAKKPGSRPAGSPGGQRRGTPRPSSYKVDAKPPRRFSASTMAMAAVAVVVVLVVVLVVVKITGSSSSNSSTNTRIAPVDVPANASTVAALESVPVSVENAVGLPSGITTPSVDTGQPPLVLNGKPGVVFIGGEFCPLCGAERWALILAFSHFGTFSGLKETTSSPWDSDPDTPTFSFYGATYTSSLLTFQPVEYESNDVNGLGTRHVLTPLNSQQQGLWTKYETHFGQGQGFPFADFGNKVFIITPSYNPGVLAGLDQGAVAALLKNASSPVTQGIVGTANYLTAGICSMTKQQPSAVCSISAVTKADKALGLSS